MSLAAGELNRPIAVQKRQTGEDEAGQPVDAWVDFKPLLWSKILGQTGMGSIVSMQGDISAPVKAYSFRVRYREDIDESMRVLYRGVVYAIDAVRLDLDRREWTDLVCKVGGPIDG